MRDLFHCQSSNLEANELASRLETALNDQSIRQQAAEIGEKIRDEHGVANAVQLVERWAAGFRL